MERKFRTSTISATQSDGGLVSKELKLKCNSELDKTE